jgi:hypothetical protein
MGVSALFYDSLANERSRVLALVQKNVRTIFLGKYAPEYTLRKKHGL